MKKIKYSLFLLTTLTASLLPGSENKEPQTAQEYCTKAEAYENQKKIPQALENYEKALQIKPCDPTILFHLGRIEHYAGNRDKSIFYLTKLAQVCPNSFIVHETLALVYRAAGMLDEEKDSLEKAIKIDPNHAYLNTKLMEYYLRRQEISTVISRWPQQDIPWYGQSLIDATYTIPLVEDGLGIGDKIQMLRYAKILKELGATVIVQTSSDLSPLLSLCPYIDTIIPTTQPLSPHTQIYKPSLCNMALKVLANTNKQAFTNAYLYADKKLEEFWHKKIGSNQTFKIGIFWESNRVVDYYETKSRPSDRSIPLKKLAHILEIPGIACYSLQKVHGLSEYTHEPFFNKIIDFTSEMDAEHGRFMDTAALMKNMDLVITVDTSIAHLAGALGIPVWTMLRHAADWRWFTAREDSPWYPSMRLFRQPKKGDWDSVVAQISTALTPLLEQKKQSLTEKYKNFILQAAQHNKELNYTKSLRCYIQALECMPDKKELLPIIALTYYTLNDKESALQFFQKAAQAFPNNPDYPFNVGFMAKDLGKLDIAVQEFKKAIAIAPSYVRAREKLGYTYLTLGHLQEGWAQFRSLDRQDPSIDNEHRLYDRTPQGKTIMVKDTGGYGDLFQFIRHAETLKKRGAYIVFYARPEIIPLLSRCPFFDKIVSQQEPVPPFDYYTNIAKMREDLDVSLETIPANIPYIHPDPALVKKWAAIVASDTQFKIGISWKAQMYEDEKTGKPIPCPRSIPINTIKKLIDEFPFISFYNLQRNADIKPLNQCPNFYTFDTLFDKKNGRFMDTAAVMKSLDLVISVDTSIAHLAGALGVPVWTLICKTADWRWFINREDSPWYPTMRLFRQQKEGDWVSVIHRIIDELPVHILKKETAR